MFVQLENIQGFKGNFHFSLDDDLNNITAKFNGTGKTTFFECLKLLCSPTCLSKSELEFMVNKDCSSCRFAVVFDNVIFGFTYDRKHLTYFRIYEGEDVERSHVPFEDVHSYVGVYLVDDVFINICDRFINLFSNSNERLNFSLVEALTSHKRLNAALTLAEQAISANKEHLAMYQREASFVRQELQNVRYFPNIENFRKLLEDSAYITSHDLMVDMLDLTKRYSATAWDVDLLPIELPVVLHSFVDRYLPLREELSSTELTVFTECYSLQVSIRNLHKVSPSISVDCMEVLLFLRQMVTDYQPVYFDKILDVLAQLLLLSIQYQPIQLIQSPGTLPILSAIKDLSVELLANTNAGIEAMTKEAKLRSQLTDVQVGCPIHGTVYLIGGECVVV